MQVSSGTMHTTQVNVTDEHYIIGSGVDWGKKPDYMFVMQGLILLIPVKIFGQLCIPGAINF